MRPTSIACVALLYAVAIQPARANDPRLATQRLATRNGPPRARAIFLHGLGGEPNTHLIRNIFAELEQRGAAIEVTAPWLRPVAVDGRGEIREAGVHTMTDQLRRARAAIEAQPGPVVLIGHSFGGKAALQLAKEYPGKVKAVVAIAPSVKMLYAYYKQITGQRGLPDRATVERALDQHHRGLEQTLARPGLDQRTQKGLRSELRYLQVMRDLAAHDEPRMEQGIATPTLVLHGTDDQAVSIHYTRRLAEANPGMQLVEYPGLDHGMSKWQGLHQDQQATQGAARDAARRIHEFAYQHVGE